MNRVASIRIGRGAHGGWWSGLGVVMALAGSPSLEAGSYECLIEPNQVVEVRSAIEGLIEHVYVNRGDSVKAGQVLARLESSVEQAAMEMARYRTQMEGRVISARNRLDYATKKLDRSQQLHKQNYIAAESRDEAEAEKRIAEADLKDALENQELAKHDYRRSLHLLERHTLRSPFDGVVVDRMLNPGDLAESGTGRKPILRLAQIEPLRVEVVLPLAAYGKLRVGAIADVIPEVLGGRHAASITVVDSVFDSASGTFGVRLELPNPNGALPAGIRCRVEFPQIESAAAEAGQVEPIRMSRGEP